MYATALPSSSNEILADPESFPQSPPVAHSPNFGPMHSPGPSFPPLVNAKFGGTKIEHPIVAESAGNAPKGRARIPTPELPPYFPAAYVTVIAPPPNVTLFALPNQSIFHGDLCLTLDGSGSEPFFKGPVLPVPPDIETTAIEARMPDNMIMTIIAFFDMMSTTSSYFIFGFFRRDAAFNMSLAGSWKLVVTTDATIARGRRDIRNLGLSKLPNRAVDVIDVRQRVNLESQTIDQIATIAIPDDPAMTATITKRGMIAARSCQPMISDIHFDEIQMKARFGSSDEWHSLFGSTFEDTVETGHALQPSEAVMNFIVFDNLRIAQTGSRVSVFVRVASFLDPLGLFLLICRRSLDM